MSISKRKKFANNDLNFYLNKLEKKSKISKRKDIMVRTEIRDRKQRNIKKVHKIKSCFLEKMNKIVKLLARLIKKK